MLCPSLLQSDPPLPLLITGVTGVSGYQAFSYFRHRYPDQVFAIRQESNWPMSGPGIVPCNAEDPTALSALFHRHQFRSVLNCAGNCALKSCELDPAMAWRLNLTGLRTLLDVIDAGKDIRLIHLSIDLVFSGRGQGGHVEEDCTDPVTIYGKSMAAAEHLVALAQPRACTLRISLPMGVSYSGHAGAIDWIQWRFMNNRPATLYYDEIRTPAYTDCLNQVIHYALTSDMDGLYHAGGQRRLSLFQIAQIVNRIGGYDPDLLIGCYRREAGPMPPRAGNVTMNSKKLDQKIGQPAFDAWPFDDQHCPENRKWHYARGEQAGSTELLAHVLYRNTRFAIPNQFSDRQIEF
jgi:dTDP-4-dehydrorhamnose reductase